MKKTAVLLLAFLLVFSLFSCSKKDSDIPEGKEVAGYNGGNTAVDYSFFYPERWELSENTGIISIRCDCNISDQIASYATISVMAFTLNENEKNMGAKTYWENYRKDVESTYKDFKMLDDKEVKLDNVDAYRVKYSASLTENKYTFCQVICVRYGTAYLITLTAKENEFESVFADFESVCGDFKFK